MAGTTCEQAVRALVEKELGIFEEINVANSGEKPSSRGDVAIMVHSLDKYKGDTATKKAMELTAVAKKKTTEVKSMSYQTITNTVIHSGGETHLVTAINNVDCTVKPMAIKVVHKRDQREWGRHHHEYYVLPENGVTMIYLTSITEGEIWDKKVYADSKDLNRYNAMEDMNLYLSGYESIRIEANDYSEKAMAGMSNFEGLLKNYGTDVDRMQPLYKDAKGIAYCMWIDDASGIPVKYDVDMADMVRRCNILSVGFALPVSSLFISA